MGLMEQAKQDNFLDVVGRKKAEKLQKIWVNTYPRYCSIRGEYPKQHTKEEVFKDKAQQEGFKDSEINLFLNL